MDVKYARGFVEHGGSYQGSGIYEYMTVNLVEFSIYKIQTRYPHTQGELFETRNHPLRLETQPTYFIEGVVVITLGDRPATSTDGFNRPSLFCRYFLS